MARVYADVNQHMPKSYWEYDSVNITWGVLENYEVVRKIGQPALLLRNQRVLALIVFLYTRPRQILRGIRGNQYRKLSEMRYQGAEARQEEEDQKGNQDLTKSERRA